MSLNFKEIDRILEELDLPSSRIDKINQPDRFSLYLETYKPGKKQKILIGLHHGAVRISRTDFKPVMPSRPPRFAQLLRARIKSGRIISAEQPSGERILQCELSTIDGLYTLWIRLWNGNPNIILTGEDHRIIDLLYRKSDKGEMPGDIFLPDFELMGRNRDKSSVECRTSEGYPDFNSFIDNTYNKVDENELLEQKRAVLIRSLEKKKKSLSALERKILQRTEDYARSEEMKLYGELIASNLHRMSKGWKILEAENYYTGEKLTIPLKMDLTPAENSEDYYKKSRKYRKGLAIAEKELADVRSRMEDINCEIQRITKSSSLEALKTLEPEEKIKEKAPRGKANPPGLRFHSGRFEILVGRNSKENDKLLRKYARGNDMWLHVRQFPGGFVFIRSLKGKTIPLDTLLDGANLALLYSSAKKGISADVHYTEVKNLRRIKGGSAGQVIVNNDRNLHVTYDEKRISRLQGKSDLERKKGNSDN